MSSETQGRQGPLAYENWRAATQGAATRAVEYPLYTDAHITGEVTQGWGPYQLLNSVAIPGAASPAPAIVLRVEERFGDRETAVRIGGSRGTDVDRYHGGGLADEIAALVSLCLGARMKAGGMSRSFEAGRDPRGHPHAFDGWSAPALQLASNVHRPLLPRFSGTRSLDDAAIVARLPELSPAGAVALVRAARLYQDAVWIAESEPELAWLMLVSAVETAAECWKSEADSPVERMRATRPDVLELLESRAPELVEEVVKRLASYMGSTKKFADFVVTFAPGPPEPRPPEHVRVDWTPAGINRAARKIYDWRSRALHGGVPFPAPMCAPGVTSESDERPLGGTIHTRGGSWDAADTPMLLWTFEHVARRALLKWWAAMPAPAAG